MSRTTARATKSRRACRCLGRTAASCTTVRTLPIRRWTATPACNIRRIDRDGRRLRERATAPVGSPTLPAGAIASADGKWVRSRAKGTAEDASDAYASEFEKRHQERFKGVTFDWKDFQRDGGRFPAPNLSAQPGAADHAAARRADGAAKTLVDMDLRPGESDWHPDGQLLAFTADADFRDELKYDHADLWTVTTDGKVTRLTDDGDVYSDVDFSPDGKYLSYARTFGTDMIIQQKLNHGGPRDLYIRPVDGGAADQPDRERGISSRATRAGRPTAGSSISPPRQAARCICSASRRRPAAKVEQVTQGAAAAERPDDRQGLHDDRLHRRRARRAGRCLRGEHRRHERAAADRRSTSDLVAEIAFSKAERLQWPSKDGTAIEGWLTCAGTATTPRRARIR